MRQIAFSASRGGDGAMTVVAARDLARSRIRVDTIAPESWTRRCSLRSRKLTGWAWLTE
ncbi:hypothetical protein AB4Y87_25345 [Paenarthrobacter sp. RAF54_2]|uniref:hypothetical protein n=1 Tax=Paenarthrobacter sp. RAF54_2 TaxID=3233061 RepID=UPI003F977817